VTRHEQAFLRPRVLVPFIIITLIWGSTWIVIKDQLGPVPPSWSVTYRYVIACTAMFVYAAAKRSPLRIGFKGHLIAASFGLPQFFLNFNFVYAAEQYITSGVVAVVFALLLVPNSLFSWFFLKHRITRRFLIGSAIAVGGVGLLFVNEVRAAAAAPGAVLIGLGLTLLGVLSASVSNVLQATERVRAQPVVSMVAWGMFYGTAANAVFALLVAGAPWSNIGRVTGWDFSISASSRRRSPSLSISRSFVRWGRGGRLIRACSSRSSPWLFPLCSRIITGPRSPSRAEHWQSPACSSPSDRADPRL
jgi:drug/metabolite transporter (DMT)-like permease